MIEITLSSRFWQTPNHNLLFDNSDNDELTGTPPKASIKSCSSFFILLVFSYTYIPGSAPIFIPSILVSKYTNKDL